VDCIHLRNLTHQRRRDDAQRAGVETRDAEGIDDGTARAVETAASVEKWKTGQTPFAKTKTSRSAG